MKTQHRVKFKSRPKKPRKVSDQAAAAAALAATAPVTSRKSGNETKHARDATKATVTFSERELKFARALTDTERHVRDASLQSLRTFLADNADGLSDAEWARLWKALFYCVWMADKRPVISAVVNDIVALADVGGMPFLRALFACLSREWLGMDRLRINKFYELTDKAMARAAADVVKAAVDAGEETAKGSGQTEKKPKGNERAALQHALGRMLAMLDETVFAGADRSGLGLALHVLDKHLDIFVAPVLRHASRLPGHTVHGVFDALMETPLLLLSSTKGYAPAVCRRTDEQILQRLPEFLDGDDLELTPKNRRDMVRRVMKRVWAAASQEKGEGLEDVHKLLYDAHLSLKAFVNEADAAMAADKEPKPDAAAADTAAAEDDDDDGMRSS